MNIIKHFKKKMKCKGGFLGTLATIGAAVGVGSAVAGTAGFGAAALVGGGTLLAGGLALGSLGKSLFGKGPELPSLSAPPATPSFEEAQGTSLEEQRNKLRGKSKTVLTSNNLLATQGETTQKTLLGN